MPENPFRPRAGLFLLGGGALGAWQASVLSVLERRCGPAFGDVLGFSAGALNGAGYFLGRVDSVLENWRSLDGSILRFSPRLFPLSLFSNEPLRRLIGNIQRGGAPKDLGRCSFTVLSACPARRCLVYAAFTPRGQDGWDGSLGEHLLASSSIPFIWPSVRADYKGRRLSLIDGGVPMEEPVKLDPLAGCQDILILSMVRPQEKGRRRWGLLSALDQKVREILLRLQDQAVSSLGKPRPRLYLLTPSRTLDFNMLDFAPGNISGALALGALDAASFLGNPDDFLLP